LTTFYQLVCVLFISWFVFKWDIIALPSCFGICGSLWSQGDRGIGVPGQRGQSGPQGEDGSVGPQGNYGPSGPDGAPGPTGQDGLPGPRGSRSPMEIQMVSAPPHLVS